MVVDAEDDAALDEGDIFVSKDTSNEQEREVNGLEEMGENDQSFESTSSNNVNVLPMSPCSRCTEKNEKIISLQKLKSSQKNRLKKRTLTIRELKLEIRGLEAVSSQTIVHVY